MASDPVTFIIYLLIASILLWLCLYLASSWIISKEYASNKKLMLLISAIILVLLVPLISGGIGSLLGDVGTLFADLRNLVVKGGSSQTGVFTIIIAFLLFMLILKFLCGMERWDKVLWISLIGLFLLYCFYSAFPELMSLGSVF